MNGIHTGVDLACCEKIVLADDDIRYTSGDIARTCALLDRYEMVRPQNYLSPLPWWARTEAARMLINRGALRTGDYPGTCAFRRSVCLRVGHYDGDVLFDNEEIVRHFALSGANVYYALDLFILKRPPTLQKWLEQRPRQAYEDFVMRAKTIVFLSLLPIAILLYRLYGGPAALVTISVASLCAVMLAWRGLWRDKGIPFFPLPLCYTLRSGFSSAPSASTGRFTGASSAAATPLANASSPRAPGGRGAPNAAALAGCAGCPAARAPGPPPVDVQEPAP